MTLRKSITSHRSIVAVLVAVACALASCGTNDSPVDPDARLCGGESGLAANITGRATPVEFCVAAKDVAASINGQGQYDLRASTTIDNVFYEIQMILSHQTVLPADLTPTGDLSVVAVNPQAVWIFYQEIPQSGAALESVAVTAGNFTLSFSDGDVAVSTFANIRLSLAEAGTSTPAGSRTLTEGFFAIAADPAPSPRQTD